VTAARTIQLSPRQKLHKRAARALIEAVGGVTAAEIRDGNILGELEDVQRSAAQLTALCRSVTGEDR
jgi:hypothetical protein